MMGNLTWALIVTILIEMGVLLLLGEKRRKVLLASVIINILTNIPLNLYLLYVGNGWSTLLIGELLVVLMEALWYDLFIKNLYHAAIYSLLCNAISFLTGALIQLVFIIHN